MRKKKVKAQRQNSPAVPLCPQVGSCGSSGCSSWQTWSRRVGIHKALQSPLFQPGEERAQLGYPDQQVTTATRNFSVFCYFLLLKAYRMLNSLQGRLLDSQVPSFLSWVQEAPTPFLGSSAAGACVCACRLGCCTWGCCSHLPRAHWVLLLSPGHGRSLSLLLMLWAKWRKLSVLPSTRTLKIFFPLYLYAHVSPHKLLAPQLHTLWNSCLQFTYYLHSRKWPINDQYLE